MDPFLDPQIDRFWDLKTIPKMELVGLQNGAKIDKNNKN